VRFTSFPHPKEELGEKVAENLLKMMENPLFDGNYIFGSKPVIRDSIYKIG
jgi:GntR family transcriptional regulator of arabinose operon